MSQGPGGPPFGPPPSYQPQGPTGLPPSGPPPAPAPAPPRPADKPAAAADATDSVQPTGTARLLAMGAAGLAVLFFIIGLFVPGLNNVYLLGGGLLTGAAVLPKAGRVLLPGAVIVLTGALGQLQAVTGIGATAGGVIGLIIAILAAGAAVGAYLLDAGIISQPAPRPAGYGGQQWPPQQQGYGGPPPGYPGGPGYGQQQPGFGAPGPGPGQGFPPPPVQTGGWGPVAPGSPTVVGGSPLGGAGGDTGARTTVTPSPARADADDFSATAAIPITSLGKPDADRPTEADRAAGTDRPNVRPSDETSLFADGGLFKDAGGGHARPEPAPEDGPPAGATAGPPEDRTTRTERSTSRHAEKTSTFDKPPAEPADAYDDRPWSEKAAGGTFDGRPYPDRAGPGENPSGANGTPPSDEAWFDRRQN